MKKEPGFLEYLGHGKTVHAHRGFCEDECDKECGYACPDICEGECVSECSMHGLLAYFESDILWLTYCYRYQDPWDGWREH